MGFLKRFKRITVARIESFLSSAEDPEVLFPHLVREMEEQLALAVEAEAKASAAVKRGEREIAEARDRMKRLADGAAAAMKRGDETTAREAVVAQIDAEQSAQQKEELLGRSRTALANATAARQQIRSQLEELRAKKDQILTRARVAKARKKTQETVQGTATSTESILDAVARMEARVEETEAELDIQQALAEGGVVETSLDRRLKELGRQAEIENRLAALKGQAPASKPKDA